MGGKKKKKERKTEERERYLNFFFSHKLVTFKSLLEGYFNSDFDEISVYNFL